MTLFLFVRRTLVIVGVVGALLVGAVSIRAAAEWTAAAAPLAVPPASLNSIDAALQAEQARSANLEAQLQTLESASGELATALAAAKDKVTSDSATAASLRKDLAAAQAKLKALQASLAKAARAPVTTIHVQAAPPASSGSGPTAQPHDD